MCVGRCCNVVGGVCGICIFVHNLLSMRIFLFSFFVLALYFTAFTQVYTISTYGETDERHEALLEPNSTISQNDLLNEQILDLVNPALADSVFEKKKQHHKVGPFGWMIHAFGGLNWRATSMSKEKIVGTIYNQGRSGKELFTEYDIIYDLIFHMPKYQRLMFEQFDAQRETKRQDWLKKGRIDYDVPPFIRDTNNIDINLYKMHCEVTPHEDFLKDLHYVFFPTLPDGSRLKDHANFMNDHPSVGMYGVLCLDCNHDCHPEMHPYEWIWWLKCTDDDQLFDKEWHVGLLIEGSNRMKKWSYNPKVGSINIPFAFSTEKDVLIEIEHGLYGEFIQNSTFVLPKNTFGASVENRTIQIQGNGVEKSIEIRICNPLKDSSIQYWLSDLNYDESNHIISGNLMMFVSILDLYTVTVRIKQE